MNSDIEGRLEEYIQKHRSNPLKSESFSEYLFALMRERGIDNPSLVYSKANISRQTYSAFIKSNSPSLNSCLKLAFALGLDAHECKHLLKKAGFTLASSSVYALIVRFSLENKLSLYECNALLKKHGFDEVL